MRITASQTVHGNLTALDPKKAPASAGAGSS